MTATVFIIVSLKPQKCQRVVCFSFSFSSVSVSVFVFDWKSGAKRNFQGHRLEVRVSRFTTIHLGLSVCACLLVCSLVASLNATTTTTTTTTTMHLKTAFTLAHSHSHSAFPLFSAIQKTPNLCAYECSLFRRGLPSRLSWKPLWAWNQVFCCC